MPEYYFDEDIDNNRLGIINFLASNLEYLSKLIQSQHLPTKKELCQEIYEKPYTTTVPSDIASKKEFGGSMFGQDSQGVPPDFPARLLMPLGDMPTTSMASFHDVSMYQRPVRPQPINASEDAQIPKIPTTKDSLVSTNEQAAVVISSSYRLNMRDASTCTSPMNVELSAVSGDLPPEAPPRSLTMEMKPEDDVMTDDEPAPVSDASRTAPQCGVSLLAVTPKQPPHSSQLTMPEKPEVATPVLKSQPRSLTSPPPSSCARGCATVAGSTVCSIVSGSSGKESASRENTEAGGEGEADVPTEGECEAVCSSGKGDVSDEKTETHKCGHCSELFKARRALVRHMRVHPVDKAYPCDHCGKLFSRNSALINHKRTHSKDKAYMCDQCGLSMPTRNDLSSHELTHVGVRPFVCQDCGKSFKKAGALSTHRKLHTGDTPFVCEFCGKAFTSNGNLENHLRVHSGDKPYSCEYCGKAFNTTANLNRHVRIHTGEKPYVCDWCNKAFSQSYALVIHKRIHTGEQPYFCKQCGKTFSDNSTLYKHKRIHKDTTMDEVLPVPSKMVNRKPPTTLEMPLAMPGGNNSNGPPQCVLPGQLGTVSSCGPMPLGSAVLPMPSVSAALSINPLMRIDPASVAAMMPSGPLLPGTAAAAVHAASRITTPFVTPRPMIDASTAAMDVQNTASRGILAHPTSNDASTMVVS